MGDYDSTVAVKENINEKNQYEIYPNPSVDKCFIRINSNQISDKAEIKIHNELGEVLDVETTLINYDGTELIYEINTSYLGSSIYFAVIKFGQMYKSIPFITNKYNSLKRR